jgi:hypothetical protein
MKRLIIATLLLTACQSSDPCAGHDGSCIGLEIDGQGVDAVDQLRLSIEVTGGAAPLLATTPGSPGAPVTLPGHTAVYLDPGVAGAATLFVDGYLNGQKVGQGSTPVQIVAGAHESATVTLRSPTGDGGMPDDLAGGDLGQPGDLSSTDLGPVPPCPTNSTFCDNFEGETGSFAKWNGSMSGPSATFMLDNTHPFLNGTTSFEVQSTGSQWVLKKTLATATGFLATRFYVYVSSALPDTTTLLAFINTDTSVAFSVGGGANWKLHSTADFAGPAIVLNQWQCVEVDVDLTQSTMQLYVTDATNPDRAAPPVASGSVAVTSTPGPFYLGVYAIPSGASTDVWFDDVVVAGQHVGCE